MVPLRSLLARATVTPHWVLKRVMVFLTATTISISEAPAPILSPTRSVLARAEFIAPPLSLGLAESPWRAGLESLLTRMASWAQSHPQRVLRMGLSRWTKRAK